MPSKTESVGQGISLESFLAELLEAIDKMTEEDWEKLGEIVKEDLGDRPADAATFSNDEG